MIFAKLNTTYEYFYFYLDLETLFENPQKPASIFEQDNNNSFFSSNFSKLTNGKTSPGMIILNC